MINKTMLVKIILPSETGFKEEASMVNIPGSEGMFGVLPGHVGLIASLKQGIVSIFSARGEKKFFIDGGIARITATEASIISEFATPLDGQTKADILNKIRDMEARPENQEKNSLEAAVLNATIARYNSLLNYLES